MSEQEQPKPRLFGAPRSWLEWALQVGATGVFTAAVAYFTEFSNDFTVLSGAYYHPEAITMPLTWATLNRKRASAKLAEALDAMEGSDLVREALGDHIFEWFLRNKRAEWAEYKAQVTPFELTRYLPTW